MSVVTDYFHCIFRRKGKKKSDPYMLSKYTASSHFNLPVSRCRDQRDNRNLSTQARRRESRLLWRHHERYSLSKELKKHAIILLQVFHTKKHLGGIGNNLFFFFLFPVARRPELGSGQWQLGKKKHTATYGRVQEIINSSKRTHRVRPQVMDGSRWRSVVSTSETMKQNGVIRLWISGFPLDERFIEGERCNLND